jgi:hypothetical protein
MVPLGLELFHMDRFIVLAGLMSLLTGCSARSAPATTPGVSLELSYPVLLVSDRNLIVKDDEASLTTTTAASGVNFPEYKIIDSSGRALSVVKVTSFGKRSEFLDMGTTPFRVFLELKRESKLSIEDIKELVANAALAPNGIVSGTNGAEIAKQRIDACKSLSQLIDACRKTWEWR